MNDLKVFQRNPLKPFWPPLAIQREFDAYVLSRELIRYDLPDPTSKHASTMRVDEDSFSGGSFDLFNGLFRHPV